jgi:hypothetical protein
LHAMTTLRPFCVDDLWAFNRVCVLEQGQGQGARAPGARATRMEGKGKTIEQSPHWAVHVQEFRPADRDLPCQLLPAVPLHVARVLHRCGELLWHTHGLR